MYRSLPNAGPTATPPVPRTWGLSGPEPHYSGHLRRGLRHECSTASLLPAPRCRPHAGPYAGHTAWEQPQTDQARGPLTMPMIVIAIIILALIGALPTWPHSANWGYYPSGGLGTVLVIIVVLMLLGRI